MNNILQKLSFFEEARVFRLRVWQTPSFLFLIMGLVTIFSTHAAYFIASRNDDDPTVLIITISAVASLVFVIGVLIVKVTSKIIIINHARTEFLSLVSHQMRSPLTGTKYTFELLLTINADSLTPQQRELIKQGHESNERMLLLVNDLLSLTRMADGDSAFDFETTTIEPLITSVCKELTINADKKNIRIITNIPTPSPPPIQLDVKKIRFVIYNIVDNAIKYTPPRGVVTVSTALGNKQTITIDIADTGIGIPQEEINKLFTKFFRATNASLSQKVGTGLGLYIAKSIVDRHFGNIAVKSALGKGSTFHITLPLKQKKKY